MVYYHGKSVNLYISFYHYVLPLGMGRDVLFKYPSCLMRLGIYVDVIMRYAHTRSRIYVAVTIDKLNCAVQVMHRFVTVRHFRFSSMTHLIMSVLSYFSRKVNKEVACFVVIAALIVLPPPPS